MARGPTNVSVRAYVQVSVAGFQKASPRNTRVLPHVNSAASPHPQGACPMVRFVKLRGVEGSPDP